MIPRQLRGPDRSERVFALCDPGVVARRRFFVDQIHSGEAVLTGDEAQHLTRVLRVEAGQRYEISDDRTAWLAEVMEARKSRIVFRTLEPLPAAPAGVPVTAVLSLVKFDRFEWLVEKATELGVANIVPVEAERSEKGLLEAARKRVERWRRIAREASQQSRRDHLPRICEPMRLSAYSSSETCRWMLEEARGAAPLASTLLARPDRRPDDTVAILCGPEGGWTEPERVRLQGQGWRPVSLGHSVLRAETAVLSALAVLNALLALEPFALE